MTDFQATFRRQFPNALFLDSNHHDGLDDLLKARGWIRDDEVIRHLEKPGEGNMNFVVRVVTDQRAMILKQSRPWVQKYPQVAAPAERVVTEARFYEVVQSVADLETAMPGLLGFDEENLLIALEDLGPNSDFTVLYRRSVMPDLAALRSLVRFLSELHNADFGAARAHFPDNQALKGVNHQHIFEFPYREESGFDLDTVQPGLQALAMNFKRDEALKSRVRELGDVYLGTGPCLLHGDFYPGSWLNTADGAKVIDPEFAYFGRPEYDVAVLVAHLRMARLSTDQIGELLRAYEAPSGFDAALCAGFSGAEVLRRLIGLAQLPVDLSLEEKQALLAGAREAVLQPAAAAWFA